MASLWRDALLPSCGRTVLHGGKFSYKVHHPKSWVIYYNYSLYMNSIRVWMSSWIKKLVVAPESIQNISFFFLINFPFRIFLTLQIDTKKGRTWYSWPQNEQWNLNDLTRTSNCVFVGIGILVWMDQDSVHCSSFYLFFCLCNDCHQKYFPNLFNSVPWIAEIIL